MKKIIAIILALVTTTSAYAYSDISSSDPDYEAVQSLTEQGILEGYNDGKFHPERSINRAEYTKMLVSAFYPDFDYHLYKNCFPDVTNQWYAPYICYAHEQGWIMGYRDGKFHPEKLINLAEGLKIDLEVAGIDPTACEDTTGAGTWYAPYLCAAKQAGIISEEEYQNPGKILDRGETAGFMYFTQKYEKPAGDDTDDDKDNDKDSPTGDDDQPGVTYEDKPIEDTSSPSDDFLISNTQKVKLLETSLSANLENVWGQKVGYTFTGSPSNFTNFYLAYPNSEDTHYHLQTQAVENKIIFNITTTGERIYIPKNAEAKVELYADVAPSSGIAVGEKVKFTFSDADLEGIGEFSQSPYTSSSIAISGDTTSKEFTMSKGALSLTTNPNSPSEYRTQSVSDTIAIFDLANASSKSSTIEMLNVSLSGSLIHSSANLVNLKIYDNASKSSGNLVVSVSASPTDGQVDFGQITTFTKPIEIGSASTKSLYVVVDTTDGDCTVPEGLCSSSSGNATFQILISDYSWSNDGAIFRASDIGGVSLPVEGNVLKY